MKIKLNVDKHEMFWFTTDGKIHVNRSNPVVNITSPSTLSLQTIGELVKAHGKGRILVDNIAFLKQLYKEGLNKEQKRQRMLKQPPSRPRDIQRTKPISIGDEKEKDEALSIAMLPVAKLKTTIAQTNDVALLAKIYQHENEKKMPRKSALSAVEERLNELGSPLVLMEQADAIEIEETEEGKIIVDQETGEVEDYVVSDTKEKEEAKN